MIANRSIVSLFVLSLLAAGLVPVVGAREAADATDVDAASVPHAAPESSTTTAPVVLDPAAPAADPLGPALCMTGCVAVAGEADALSLVSPEAGGGSLPGEPVTIMWKAQVYDMLRSGQLFKVQVKSQAVDATWETVQPYTCYQAEEDAFPTGTCKATWAPDAGIYAVRVILLSSELADNICFAGVNCELVTPYFVDGRAVALDGLCIAGVDGCVPTTTTLTAAVQPVTVGAEDDLAIHIVSVFGQNAAGTVACGLFEASESADSPPVTEIASGLLTCDLDLTSILDHPTEDAYVGTFTLGATGIDRAGNIVTITDGTYTVDTSPTPIASTVLTASVPTLVPNGEDVVLNFRTTYAAPVALLGKPVKNQPFVVKDDLGATVCTGTTGTSGITQCVVSYEDAARVLTGGVTPSEDLDAVARSVPVTWTGIVVTRAETEDAPRSTLFANPGEVYEPAYVVTFSYDDSPVAGALVSLAPSGGDASFETTDENGLVRVPVVSDVTNVVGFDVAASTGDFAATGLGVTVTWSRIVVSFPAVDDGFVDVGDDVTLTATATYEHDPALFIESATLTLADGAPEGCELSTGAVTDGALTAIASCSVVHATPLALVVEDSTRGITSLSAPLALAATWTRIEVSGLSTANDFVNVGDAVTMTGTATYAHDGTAVPTATLSLVDAPADCTLDTGEVTLGALTAKVTCTQVHDLSVDGLTFDVASGHEHVTLLAEPLVLHAIWTSVTVTSLAVDDDFVNVGDAVGLTGLATLAHDGSSVAAATLALGAAAPEGCTLSSGGITDGALSAVVSCATVQDASATGIPLVIATSPDGITALTSPVSLQATWTNVVVSGLILNDAFVNVGDAVTLTGAAAWAHNGAAVPTATLAFAPGVPEACTLNSGSVTDGALTATVACTAVSDFSATGIPLVLATATDEVTQLSAPVALQAVWTRIVLSGLAVDDELVNVDDPVTLTGVAKYAHDDSAVPEATIVFGEGASEDCSMDSGAVANGALSVVVRCDDVVDLSTTGIPLVVGTAHQDVTQLQDPLALHAIWTKLKVTYVTDTSRKLLEPGAPVVFTATVSFAHNDAPVEGAAAIVKSRTPGDAGEFVCLTDETGTCVLEVTKTAGEFVFDMTAFSTTIGEDGRLVPDITSMAAAPAPVTYRWTAIAFEEFVCVANGAVSGCDSVEFGIATPVLVRVRAVAADTGEALPGVEIKLGGQTMTTNADGEASRTFTRFSAGGVTVTARGVSWMVGDEVVNWTTPRSETLLFV